MNILPRKTPFHFFTTKVFGKLFYLCEQNFLKANTYKYHGLNAIFHPKTVFKSSVHFFIPL